GVGASPPGGRSFPAQPRLCTFLTFFSSRSVTSLTARPSRRPPSLKFPRCPTPLDALPASRNWAPRKARSHALFAHPGRGACAPGGRSFAAQPRLRSCVTMFSPRRVTSVTDRRFYCHQSTKFARCPTPLDALPDSRNWAPRKGRTHTLLDHPRRGACEAGCCSYPAQTIH